MHLKRQGQYICRTLSYHGCAFSIDEQALDPTALSTYDAAARFWIKLYQQLVHSLDNGGLDNFPRKKQPNTGRNEKSSKSNSGNSKRRNRRPSDTSAFDESNSSDEDFDDEDSGTSDDDSLFDFGDSAERKDKEPLLLPFSDMAAKAMVIRYFWSKLCVCHFMH